MSDAAQRGKPVFLAFTAASGECYGRMGERESKTVSGPLEGDDRSQFERAFREHYPSVLAFARRRVQSDAEAADIAQEAYLRVLRYREGHDQEVLKALLFQIAANLIGMRLRQAHAQHWASRVPVDENHPLAADDPPLDRQAAGEQELSRLIEVVQGLPRKCQQAFVLNRFHGLGQAEVAARMKISVKMVEKHIAHALNLCRRKLGSGES
jgi:RNA polymerase sigma factor (sigma-70 family)